jgi:hypothetical protein
LHELIEILKFFKGYIKDNGRVITSSGAWLRARKSETETDTGGNFLPLGLENIPTTIDRHLGIAYQANSTHFISVSVSSVTAYYICERIGIKELLVATNIHCMPYIWQLLC